MTLGQAKPLLNILLLDSVFILGHRTHTLYIFKEVQLIRTCSVLWSFKGAPAVHCNFTLLSFFLYITFKTGIAAACEPIPLEKGRLGES